MDGYTQIMVTIFFSTVIGATVVAAVTVWVSRMSWRNHDHIRDILSVLRQQMDIATRLIEEELGLVRRLSEDQQHYLSSGGELKRSTDPLVLGSGDDGTGGTLDTELSHSRGQSDAQE